ncbi:4'-phosphopantetheinyl transferase family protein [Streptomyces sp. NPDC059851]|uniref:4'-phosphopantetheinyl transferase family protein n=1 Tax=Streptomyces sp. NPDC059851 TaxID=3346971 RepID=UPI0036655E1A
MRRDLPGPGEAAVWIVPLDCVPDGRPERVLDRRERARAAAFHDALGRRHYVASHLALRTVLGGCLGIAPREVRLAREVCGLPHCVQPHGRPRLSAAEPAVEFSLSRAGGLAVVALATAPVGIDVESRAFRHPDSPLDGMVRRLHPAERAALAELPPARREEGFLSCWVRKEAYLKGIGTGLPGGLAGPCVGLAADVAADGRGPTPTTRGWAFLDLDLPPGHRAALAVAAPDGEGSRTPPELTVRTLHLHP